MTAGVNNQIEIAEYNAIYAQIAAVLSTQYGQTNLNSSAVAAPPPASNATKITVAEWNALQNDMFRIADHLGIARPSITTASSSLVIKDSDRAAYLTAATALNNPSQYYGLPADTVTSATVSSLNYVNVGVGKTATHTVTMTFSSSAYATYFFNTGSIINLSANLNQYQTSGGAQSPATLDNDWFNLLSSSGTITYGRSSTSSSGYQAGVISPSTGFINATNTETTIFSKTIGDGLYTSGTADRFWITVQYNAPVLTFRMYYGNTYTSRGINTYPSAGYPQAQYYAITGQITSTVAAIYPSSSNVSASAFYPASGIGASFSSN